MSLSQMRIWVSSSFISRLPIHDEMIWNAELDSDSDSDSGIEVPLSTTVGRTSFAIPDRVQHDLISSLHKVFSQSRPPPEKNAMAPRSFAQLSQWMRPQGQAASSLLHEISKGTYVHLGLKPGAPTAPAPGS